MSISRVVPDIRSTHLPETRTFYCDFLGFELAMDMGFVMTFVSPSNPTAQITVVRDDAGSALLPDVSIEVANVDLLHQRAVERGLEVVYPLTNEPWGVRRFFVVDPNGTILNVLSHLPAGSK
jgi:catechol 2,3-dioxygenase-like lactoylglutathione lyase family enzyme